ncbi:signal recognition particle protein [[Mycoplasma] mobile]|uniref:Signal recognition particle protein n=1 Tax=Mycoplasma mobile (strain ATCC 43663 / 163K / NCTC 11711) TaxID=267748 RepID=Q6KHB7_MYCM1|nr:signal recognition particle protein [[Mycoplasma] mobile]AAT28013.1 signal recognition particle GTPase [Mycoplasma mobile 163K]
MFNNLSKRMQKSLEKMSAKTILKEEDILEITREIKLALLEADVNLIVVKEFIQNIKDQTIGTELIGKLNPGQQVIKIVKEELVKIFGNKTKEINISKKPTIFMIAGLQGGGKTTTIAKIAHFYKNKKKIEKILIVAGDIYRPAAIDQLDTLSKMVGVDIYKNSVDIKPQQTVKEAIDKAKNEYYDLVLIDTAGRLSIDEKLMNELIEIKEIAKPQEIIFVSDALSGQDIFNVAKTFDEKLKLTGSIITKLDSDARGGAALSITKMLNIPILFIGTGEKVTNLDLFHPDRMADRILGMGDVLSLIEKAQDVIDEKKSKKMFSRFMSGHFDLDDLLENLRQIKKLGKMSKLLKMIPGANKIDPEKIDKAEDKIKVFEILISSMTISERKDPRLLKNQSRKQRVIKGSGRSVQEYNLLVSEFDQMSKKMKQISKSMKDGTLNPGSLGNLF